MIVYHLLYDSTGLADRVPLWGWVATLVGNGPMGVLLFFVLSGYLITRILVGEKSATGAISIRNFYMRRVLRIWPAYFFFLGVLGALTVVGVIAITAREWTSAALFFFNYVPASGDSGHLWLAHTWSLSVEEQFYLLWPLVLVALSPRRAAQVGAVVVVVSPVIRVANYLLVPGQRNQLGIMFHTRMDSLMIGCLLALLPVAYPDIWARLQDVARRRRLEIPAVVVLLGSTILEHKFGNPWLLPFGISAYGIGFAALLLVILARPRGSLARGLSWAPLVWVGSISFSLYLWQQVFVMPTNTTITGTFPLDVACAVVAAWLSYKLIERPALRLKRRFERPVATASPAGQDAEPAL